MSTTTHELTNVREEVQTRYDELRATRQRDLNTIQEKTDVARAQLADADQRSEKATREMDIDAYEKAQADVRRAKIALQMYEGKTKQIQQQDYVTQADGDAVVDSLLKYEDDLAKQFETAIIEPLKQLQTLQADYAEEIRKTEEVIVLWTRDIRRNYRSFSGSVFHNPETGKLSNVSPSPIPVHSVNFLGCEASRIVKTFLTGKGQGLLND